ncbi:type II secretion system protein N [Stutzerimonas nosocomialis]|uniref:type II secretion system protein N n=1 Tax=Stutzerimonas nosocomialis TaxID=1056496 RepID=UPI0011086783|nr:type II secretion system protein N [Stutzerimonas nosocomialis]
MSRSRSAVVRLVLPCLLVLALLFGLLLFWPAAQWLPRVLPEDMRVQGVGGSLYAGTAERLYWRNQPIGPWAWQLRANGVLDVRLGLAGEGDWQGRLSGWPWRWGAVVTGGDLLWMQGGELGLLQARFDGEMHLEGDRSGCRSSSGALQADEASWAFPPVAFGSAEFSLDCGAALPVRLRLQRPGQHDLLFELDPDGGRGHVRGGLVPGGTSARLAQDFGMVSRDQHQVDQPLSW